MVKIKENELYRTIEDDIQEPTIIKLQDIKLGASVKESYKALRTNLLYTEATKTIAITSTLPNEGKSVTAYHLAVSFAKAGKKTLLIDCDLRKSKLYSYLHVSRELPGLSEYLSKQKGLSIYGTTFPNLYLMFSGKIPPNPAELLSSELFELMLYKWKEDFDYVILDTPPVNSAIDASIIGRYVDGVVYVVRSDYVKRKFVEISKKMIQRNGGHIVGVVLNRLDQYHANYYGYYEESE